jgi:hypothetical protein
MKLPAWLRSWTAQRKSKNPIHRRPLAVELLEDRAVPAVFPNDPQFAQQWPLHNTGQTGGTFDADIDMPEAWTVTTGSMATVVAVLDSGVDYTHPDLYLNIWLNESEIPNNIATSLVDSDGDALFTFRDLNAPANAAHVTDVNGNGYIDGGDLLNDTRWENGLDEDGNGKVDDLIGWDTHDNDNDPIPAPGEGHGTPQALRIGAIANNGVGSAGINWFVRIMPVCVNLNDATRNNANVAAGLDYAVAEGASISNNRRTNPENIFTQEMYDAMERARLAGHLCIAPAGNYGQDMDANPFYPGAYDLDNVLVIAALDSSDALSSISNWGLNNVDVAASSISGTTSEATSNATGLAALIKSLHPEWNYAQIKDRMMTTVDPLASLAGKNVTGGRLNAAQALATTSISISDPAIIEGNSGTSQMVFTVTRYGDDTGNVTLNWSTANGTATAGSDFVAAAGQITFIPGGPNSLPIAIDIPGDATQEPDERFSIQLALISGDALMADQAGQGTIASDDVPISVNDFAVIEGGQTPHFQQVFVPQGSGGLMRPRSLIFRGGYFYVLHEGANPVLRFDAQSGAFVDHFVSSNPQLNGGLTGPVAAAFGPDGNLYVVTYHGNKVFRYDGTTGAFLDIFVSEGSGGLDHSLDLAFDSAGNLYLTTDITAQVLRYDTNGNPFPGPLGTPGTAVFVPSNSGGLVGARGIVFDANGDLYVASIGNDRVLKYSGANGSFLSTFVAPGSGGLDEPHSLTIGPDGNLYVGSSNLDSVFRYRGTDGAFIDVFVTPGSGGLDNTLGLTFDANGRLYVASGFTAGVLQYGTGPVAVFTVTLAAPSIQTITVQYATGNGTAVAGQDYTATSGTLTFAPGETVKTILVPILDNAVYEPTETFTVTLSNAIGAAITDGQGVGTIADNDIPPTKFYTVDDGSANRTYEYASDGASVEDYSLTAANTAPRGAASTAAGDKVWVIDANKNVYVYNASGGLLGSWAAGGLHAQAQLEGIATNGTDIWLVDAKQDKVFKYTGAASRLSGSQSAASSFNLNSANSGPKDLVTDGVSIWVVNDGSTDKVFKYTLAGSLLGSWTLSTAGATSPTGITLDPSSPAHLWIVDNGTDRVYQYDNAVSRTSGSQSASMSFALAAGNTNPQGIADPPAGTSETGDLVGTPIDWSVFDEEFLAPRARRNARIWR